MGLAERCNCNQAHTVADSKNRTWNKGGDERMCDWSCHYNIHKQQGSAEGRTWLCVCFYSFPGVCCHRTHARLLTDIVHRLCENAATYFLFMRALPALGDKYLQWVAVRSVFVSRLPNHAQHVNTHLIISHWVFGLMRSHWTWVGPTPLALQWCVREANKKKHRTAWEKD